VPIGSQLAAWTASTQTIQVKPGFVASATLSFRQDNPASVTPTFVKNISQVAISPSALAVVFTDGTFEATGYDYYGLFSEPSFTLVGSPTSVAQIAMGADQTCTLSTGAGQVQCLGYEPGNNTGYSSSLVVALSSGVTQLAVGSEHVCALNQYGTVYCWGFNYFGQVGNTTTSSSSTPYWVAVPGGATSMVAGGLHTCAVVQGQVYCWGNNAFGQLGTGNTTQLNAPNAPVSTSSGFISGMVQIAAGGDHTCGLRADGTLFCWGDNGNGQLGNGTQTNSYAAIQLTTISGVAQVTAGANSTCARKNDGSVWCWGADNNGAVGDGLGRAAVPTPTQVGAGTLPSSVSLWSNGAMSDAFCSVGTDGSLTCWGQIPGGNGPPNDAFYPRTITL
jgi:hypothetical protein